MSESARRMLQYQERNALYLPICEAAAIAAADADDPCDSSDEWLPVRIEYRGMEAVKLNDRWITKAEDTPPSETLFHYSV